MTYIKRIMKLYSDGKVDDTTMVKMAVFKEKVEELIKEGGIDKKTLLLGAALSAGAGIGAAAVETVSDYFLSSRSEKILEKETQKVFDELYAFPEINKYSREEASKYFQTLKHFSPHIARDPLSARTYLIQMLGWNDENQAPLSVTSVRELAEVEAKAMDALNKRPPITFDAGKFTEPIVSAISSKPENLYTSILLPDKKDKDKDK